MQTHRKFHAKDIIESMKTQGELQPIHHYKGMEANEGDRRWLEVARRVLKQKKGDSQKVYLLLAPIFTPKSRQSSETSSNTPF